MHIRDLLLNNSSDNEVLSTTTILPKITEIVFENVTNIVNNATNFNDSSTNNERRLNEFHIIKAVVLSIVIIIILFSVCKMVFDLFVQYTEKNDK